MDEMERNDDPSLPPDYVSLAQLQERWIKKQQEKKLKEKEDEERETRAQNENQNRRGLKSDARQKMAGLSLNNAPQRRVEKKSGREIGVIEDGRKGEEVAIVGSGNGEQKKKKKKKKKNTRKKGKKKFAENKNGAENEKLVGDSKEIDGGDGREGVEIVNQNEVKMGIKSGENHGRGGNNGGLKGIEEIVSVNMVEVLPDVRTLDFRGGFRRNRGNSAPQSNNTRKEYRVRVDDLEKKMENEKGYGMKWRERRKNDESCYRMKENRATGVIKDKKLEPKKENKVQDEISEVCNEIDRNKTQEDRTEVQDLNDNQIEIEEKSDNEVFKVESVKSFRNGYRRNWNGSGRHGREFSGLSSNDESCYRMKENRATDVMKDKKSEPKKENKVQDEISEVCNEIYRNKTQEDRTEVQDLNDNQIEIEEKSDNEVFKVESVKSFRNGYRRNWNGSGRHGREFSGLSSNDWRTDNVRSNFGDGRRYGRNGRFEGRRDAKERESGMVWVKKDEKLAAEVGSSDDQA